MTITRLEKNTRLSEVVIFNNQVFLAGQLADDLTQDITLQTKQTFKNIDYFLNKAGTNKSQILSVTIYLKNIEQDYQAFNILWDEWIDPLNQPARTCVEAKMYDPNVLVELTVIAKLL